MEKGDSYQIFFYKNNIITQILKCEKDIRKRNDRLKSLKNTDAIILHKLSVSTSRNILTMGFFQLRKAGSTLEK